MGSEVSCDDVTSSVLSQLHEKRTGACVVSWLKIDESMNIILSDEVSENSFFTASLGHFSFCRFVRPGGLCLTNFRPGPPISSLFLLVKKRLHQVCGVLRVMDKHSPGHLPIGRDALLLLLYCKKPPYSLRA